MIYIDPIFLGGRGDVDSDSGALKMFIASDSLVTLLGI